MSAFVFQYKNGPKRPNIHGAQEHYTGGEIVKKYQSDRIKNLKVKYLNIMKARLQSQQTSQTSKFFIEALNMTDFEQQQQALESSLVDQYNLAAQDAQNFLSAYTNLEAELKTSNPTMEQVADLLDKLLEIFDKYKISLQLIRDANTQTLQPIQSSFAEILGINQLIAECNAILTKNKIYDSRTFNSLITKPSEGLSAIIASFGNKVVYQTINERLKGTKFPQNTKVTINLDKSIKSKVADLAFKKQRVNFSENYLMDDQSLTVTRTLEARSFSTIKTNRTKKHRVHLTQYGGLNSILLAAATTEELYGNTDEAKYQIYNALAWNREAKGDIAKNYKIIHSDLTEHLLLEFLGGINVEQFPDILIYNFQVYSMLNIIIAITEQMLESSNGFYGSGRKDIFKFQITKLPNNQWYGSKKSLSNLLKSHRVERVEREIKLMEARGQINFNAFNKYLNSKDLLPLVDSLGQVIPQINLT